MADAFFQLAIRNDLAFTFQTAAAMVSTKRLLVAFDPACPERQSSEFVIPWHQDGEAVLRGLQSGLDHRLGIVAFVGRLVTANDLFARLVDGGAFFDSVDGTLSRLSIFVDQVRDLKVGNIVRITQSGLELVAKSPSGYKV